MAINKVRLILVLIVVLLVGLLVFYTWALQHPRNLTVMLNPNLATREVTVGNTSVIAEVADTEASREQGLSDRSSLPQGRAMLFVFDKSDIYGFWMKDMNFSIDMVFADSKGHIVSVDSNLSPATYNQNPPQIFYPASSVLYVLELPAGFAQLHNIVVGGQLVVQ